MIAHSIAVHLDGAETIRTSEAVNHDALYVERGASHVGLVLGHDLPAADRIRFLDELAASAALLSGVIADRERVSA